MKVILITPAKKQSKAGNRATAQRWAWMLRELGHRVDIQFTWDGSPAEMMLALHAWRSADSIARFYQAYPAQPLIVALTGTDIYRFQDSHPDATIGSMEMADTLLCLHNLVHQAIPPRFASKLHVVHQSATALPGPRRPAKRHFDICILGHLRDEKDSLRAAYAVRNLPAASRIRLVHLGKAHDETWANNAAAEAAANPRYHWLGEVPIWRVRREYRKTRLMVLSSVMEGGANVISEAIVAGVPIIASKIHGAVGLLGPNYPGYFPVKDTTALQRVLLQAEADPGFVAALEKAGQELRKLFTRAGERQALAKALDHSRNVTGSSASPWGNTSPIIPADK